VAYLIHVYVYILCIGADDLTGELGDT